MIDVWLVARFEILRAVRTWRALALLVLYGIASAGAAWLFVQLVGLLEVELADQLGVAATRVPGAMLQQFVKSDTWRKMLEAMTGSPHLVASLLSVPPLALFHLWFGFLIVPFFAASASAECIALDVASRAIRYEAQRTGRIELVLGRFLGQLVLTALATVVASAVVWVVGMAAMVGNEALPLAGWLAWYTPRIWVFGVPFVAMGVAASQLTSSAAWARVMAVGGVALSWVALGVARWAELQEGALYGLLADVTLQILPQGWLRGLWEPGAGWLLSALVCMASSVVLLTAGYLRFSRRDL